MPYKKVYNLKIVDDQYSSIEGLLKVLEDLDYLNTGFVHQSFDFLDYSTDILLLDENMPISGDVVYNYIKENNIICPVIASITSMKKPDWAKYHFADKLIILKDDKIKDNFIVFIEELVNLFEESS